MSFIYSSAVDDILSGRIAFGTDRFRVMLVGEGYVPRPSHRRRSDVRGEIIGEGYALGGLDIEIIKRPGPDKVDISLGGALLRESTLDARGAVYFKNNGGSPQDDELIAWIDFGRVVTSLHGDWTLSASTLRVTREPNG